MPQSWYKNTQVHYGLKRFLMYLLIAVPASNVPFIFIGMVMGLPAIVLTAVFLSIYDGIQAKHNQATPVFTHTFWLVFASEIAIVITLLLGYFLLFYTK